LFQNHQVTGEAIPCVDLGHDGEEDCYHSWSSDLWKRTSDYQTLRCKFATSSSWHS